jgi:hypothetical protein
MHSFDCAGTAGRPTRFAGEREVTCSASGQPLNAYCAKDCFDAGPVGRRDGALMKNGPRDASGGCRCGPIVGRSGARPDGATKREKRACRAGFSVGCNFDRTPGARCANGPIEIE